MLFKNVLFYVLFLSAVINLKAQNWVGYNTSRFTGVSAVDYQPADIVGTPYKVDILVTGIKGSMFNRNILFGADLDNGDENMLGTMFQGQNQKFIATGVLYLPSVLYSINARSAVAFSTSFNAFGFGQSRTPEALLAFQSGQPISTSASYSNEFVTGYVNTWSNFNFTYAYMLLNKDRHKLKLGTTIRISQGSGSAYYSLGDISYDFSNQQLNNLSGNVQMQYNQQLEDISEGQQVPLFSKSILGGDFGAVYEYTNLATKDYQTPYLFKLSSSIRNVGKVITYQTASGSYDYSINASSISASSFTGISNLQQLKDTLSKIAVTSEPNGATYKTKIPTSFMFMVDCQPLKNVFLNASYNYTYMKLGSNANQTYDLHSFNITSRYDKLHWSVIFPMTFTDYGSGFGLAGRWRYITVGSANIFNLIFNGAPEKFAANGYVVIRIPILDSKYKKKQKEDDTVSE